MFQFQNQPDPWSKAENVIEPKATRAAPQVITGSVLGHDLCAPWCPDEDVPAPAHLTLAADMHPAADIQFIQGPKV